VQSDQASFLIRVWVLMNLGLNFSFSLNIVLHSIMVCWIEDNFCQKYIRIPTPVILNCWWVDTCSPGPEPSKMHVFYIPVVLKWKEDLLISLKFLTKHFLIIGCWWFFLITKLAHFVSCILAEFFHVCLTFIYSWHRVSWVTS